MGLDMYLCRKQHAQPGGQDALRVTQKATGDIVVEPELTTSLTEEIGYWRKASHIHKWFVDNVQKGKDDCEEYDVSRHQLEKLQTVVDKVVEHSKLVPGNVSVGQTLQGTEWVDTLKEGLVIADPAVAMALLPRQKGFFFGGEGYDQWYVEDLNLTLRILKEALGSYNNVKFTYQSSW